MNSTSKGFFPAAPAGMLTAGLAAAAGHSIPLALLAGLTVGIYAGRVTCAREGGPVGALCAAPVGVYAFVRLLQLYSLTPAAIVTLFAIIALLTGGLGALAGAAVGRLLCSLEQKYWLI